MQNSGNEKDLSRTTAERDFNGFELLLIAAQQLEDLEKCGNSLAVSSLVDCPTSLPGKRQRDDSGPNAVTADGKGENDKARKSKRRKVPSSKFIAASLNAPRATRAVLNPVAPKLNASEIEVCASGARTGPVVRNAGNGSERLGQKWVCQIGTCQKSFPTKGKLSRHTRGVHLKEKRFACTMQGCSKKYGRMQSLREHIWTVHEMKKPFECQACGAKFGRISGRSRHEKRQHGGGSSDRKQKSGPASPSRS